MSQQIINISTPDDGLGDVLRNGFDKTNQNFTELYNGKVDKVTGKGLSENDFTDADKAKLDGIEAGAEVNVQADWGETDPTADSFILNKPPSLYSAFGYFHYADLDTQTTPLSLSPSDPLQLINDTLGAFTNEDQAPYGISGVWDKPTDSLDFSQLSVGDAVLFRADLSILTTSVNQNLQLYIKFGIGTPSEYDLLIDSWNEKSVVTFKHFLKDVSFSIDNEDWRTAPAKIYILSDSDGKVKVNGWYIPIIRKSVNLIDFYSDPSKQDKLTEVNFGEFIDGLDSKTDIKDDDEFIISDSEDSLKSKKTRFLDLKTKLKSYFDTFYLSLSVFDNFVEVLFDSLDNKLDKDFTILTTADAPLNDAGLFVIYQYGEVKQLYFDDLESSFKRGTFTIDLMDLKTANFYAPNDLKINSIVNVKNAPTTTLKKNDVAYTLGTLISKGDKITVETNIFSVVNLILKYE